jgi:hypothetical protein
MNTAILGNIAWQSNNVVARRSICTVCMWLASAHCGTHLPRDHCSLPHRMTTNCTSRTGHVDSERASSLQLSRSGPTAMQIRDMRQERDCCRNSESRDCRLDVSLDTTTRQCESRVPGIVPTEIPDLTFDVLTTRLLSLTPPTPAHSPTMAAQQNKPLRAYSKDDEQDGRR